MTEGKSQQLEELESIRSIYLEDEFHITEAESGKDIQAVFLAYIELPENFVVTYKAKIDDSDHTVLHIKHLPPIELNLILPEGYPSSQAPLFRIYCQWLEIPVISRLCTKLDELWTEGENSEIIFTWCEYLKNEALGYIGITEKLDITNIHKNHLLYMDRFKQNKTNKKLTKVSAQTGVRTDTRVSNNRPVRKYLQRRRENSRREDYDERAAMKLSMTTSLVKLLINYNIDREKTVFSRTMFTCMVCFQDKLGKNCTKFSECDHVFCQECITSYLIVRINEGTVKAIKCPQDKCLSEVSPTLVRELVPKKLFERYDSLLLTITLDTLGDIIYCPRSSCQYPCTRNEDEKVVTCPSCSYSFCVFCKMVYHGVEPCKFKSDEMKKLIAQYTNGTVEERKQMELRYGKTQLQTVVNTSLSECWIKENSKNCPQCNTSIEKSEGCNKMSCWRCNAFFCWLCCRLLSPVNPYRHYNDPASPCANKLFYLVQFEDEQQEEEEWEPFDWVDLSDVSDSSDIETDEPDTDPEQL